MSITGPIAYKLADYLTVSLRVAMSRYRPPAPQGSKYITPDGAAALAEELDHLWRRKRPAVVTALAEAAAEGDRSENAEYIYRKKELRETDRRIRHLRRRLDGMRVVDEVPADTSRVFFAAWFVLTGDDGESRQYRLVGPDETDAARCYVSMDAPLGRAVIGKRIDDNVSVATPEGEKRYRITAVRYGAPPAAARGESAGNRRTGTGPGRSWEKTQEQ